MSSYSIQDGDTLVFSVNDCAWETITFAANDFQNSNEATPQEIAGVINKSGSLNAKVENGQLVLTTPSSGGHTSIRIELMRSTVAGRLGLTAGYQQAHGSGLKPARLVSGFSQPFALSKDSEMVLGVDGKSTRILFKNITPGEATAAEVANVINTRLKNTAIACPGRDGRVILTSPSIGSDSRLQVEAGRVQEGKEDAAEKLGFVERNADSHPYRLAPARLVCRVRPAGLTLVNLTSSPVEWHRPMGTLVLPARGRQTISLLEGADSQLQRLIARGVVRLEPRQDS
jgi:hypothetical protein